MALVTPTSDLKLSFTPLASGLMQIDIPIAASGDFALVNGSNRLVQDITRWLLAPQGSNPFLPQFGNPFYAAMGRPLPPQATAQAQYRAMLDAAEAYFLQVQAQSAAAGTLSLDEQVDHFVNHAIDVSVPGVVVISFTVIARSGQQTQATVNMQSGPGAQSQQT